MQTRTRTYDPKAHAAQVTRMINKAIREGRHSEKCERYCQGCGELVGELWHMTIDRKALCMMCSARQNAPRCRELLEKFHPDKFRQLIEEERAADAAAREPATPTTPPTTTPTAETQEPA